MPGCGGSTRSVLLCLSSWQDERWRLILNLVRRVRSQRFAKREEEQYDRKQQRSERQHHQIDSLGLQMHENRTDQEDLRQRDRNQHKRLEGFREEMKIADDERQDSHSQQPEPRGEVLLVAVC